MVLGQGRGWVKDTSEVIDQLGETFIRHARISHKIKRGRIRVVDIIFQFVHPVEGYDGVIILASYMFHFIRVHDYLV